jgi:hypothetical protein
VRAREIAAAELDAAQAILGDRPTACPWAAFYDDDVRLVRWAASFWPHLEHALGDAPEWWLVNGVAYYRRALEKATQAIVEKPKPSIEEKPNGGVKIRG